MKKLDICARKIGFVMSDGKLRPYFQYHPISVVISYPLRNTLHKHHLSSRPTSWAIKVRGYDLTYKLQTTIKSQVLDDSLVDFRQG